MYYYQNGDGGGEAKNKISRLYYLTWQANQREVYPFYKKVPSQTDGG